MMHDATPPDARRPNGLAGQTSPYLLQHLYNPVNWLPWCEQALERARREDKPIFLSIGYAACHWCHVMERESFENPAIAELLNRHFVPIKVDREERPDIDEIYMNAVQLLTGQGGWPLSVFLTPGLEPFMGGTYFPPEDRYGRIGFASLLERVREAWTDVRADIDRSAGRLRRELERIAAGPSPRVEGPRVGRAEASRASAELARRFEPRWGGFGGAPKFPPDGALALLLREHVRTGDRVPLEMAEKTLDAMAAGGLYDHIGGGFARYSVDERWLVPHFEKMLYNQALLVQSYLDGWLVTGKPLYRRVVEQTLDFVRREMTDASGGFYSSLDADSEGEEGKFYVWTADEIDGVLGPSDGPMFRNLYDVSPDGNFEGRNIPNLLKGSLAERAAELGATEDELLQRVGLQQERLLAIRGHRTRPATDDKILTAWNGLMLSACGRAYQVLSREHDLALARGAAGFVLEHLSRDGRLLVSHREGKSQLNAYLDDHAFLARGLLDLYEACFEPRWLDEAERIAVTMLARFEKRDGGGFYFTSDDHESLLTRGLSLHDGALPAGASVEVEVLLRLAVHRDREDFRRAAERTLEAYQPLVAHSPSAYASLLLAAELDSSPALEVAILGSLEQETCRELLGVVRRRLRPGLAIQLGAAPVEDDRLALLRGKQPIGDRPTVYVCRGARCLPPTVEAAALSRQLDAS